MRYGPQAIPELASALVKPLLCANMLNPQTGRLFDGLSPYAIERLDELTLRVIGLTAHSR